MYLKKEGMAFRCLAIYLLGTKSGDRLKTLKELSLTFGLSVGLIQGALTRLEQKHCILIQRQGRNGSLLLSVDYQALLGDAGISRLVCAMPLPYTKTYEGLASGLKQALSGLPLYFAHMRGSATRLECLASGIYDMAVMSRLAAEAHCVQPENKVEIAMTFGRGTWVQHWLIRRKNDSGPVRFVGMDSRSVDQRILTDRLFPDNAITRCEIAYDQCLNHLEKGTIDAVIWNCENKDVLSEYNLDIVPLDNDSELGYADEAALVIRKEDATTRQLLATFVNIEDVITHQRQVVLGLMEPSY